VDIQKRSEIRELSAEEIDLVAGGASMVEYATLLAAVLLVCAPTFKTLGAVVSPSGS
jgi:hypothetical protein